MNDNAVLAVKAVDILKHVGHDVHIIVRAGWPGENKIAIIPIVQEKESPDSSNRYHKVPITDFNDDIKSINMGIENVSNDSDRKLYFGHGTSNLTIIGQHDWAYEGDIADISEIRNFCKIRFGTNAFIYIASVENINNHDMILKAVEDIIGNI